MDDSCECEKMSTEQSDSSGQIQLSASFPRAQFGFGRSSTQYARGYDSPSKTYTSDWIPEHIHMASKQRRVNTFKDRWPIQMTQKADELAACGFFYSGEGDKVICFHCGMGVYKWENTDHPLAEHKKHFLNCKYILMIHGD